MHVADFPPWFVRTAAFVFASLWGSFFNVCIYRWPREMSIVSPKTSHCPHCNTEIEAWRNVPLFGYLFLRGRAACCGKKLTPRYFIVELLTALLGLALAERYIVQAAGTAEIEPALFQTLVYFAFVGGLIVATFVDLEWMEIPDEVSLPGTALGLFAAGAGYSLVSAEDAALGAGMGFLFVQLVFVWAYHRVTGRQGMGEGDPKLLMMIGAFLGWKGALFAMVAGAFQGILGAAVAYVTGVKHAPSQASESLDGWSREHLLAFLEIVLRRHPELAEYAVGAAGTGVAGGSEADAAEAAADGDTEHADPDDEQVDDAPTESTDTPTEEQADEEAAGPIKIPFGPFLALGAIEFLFFGDRVIDWYFGLLGG